MKKSGLLVGLILLSVCVVTFTVLMFIHGSNKPTWPVVVILGIIVLAGWIVYAHNRSKISKDGCDRSKLSQSLPADKKGETQANTDNNEPNEEQPTPTSANTAKRSVQNISKSKKVCARCHNIPEDNEADLFICNHFYCARCYNVLTKPSLPEQRCTYISKINTARAFKNFSGYSTVTPLEKPEKTLSGNTPPAPAKNGGSLPKNDIDSKNETDSTKGCEENNKKNASVPKQNPYNRVFNVKNGEIISEPADTEALKELLVVGASDFYTGVYDGKLYMILIGYSQGTMDSFFLISRKAIDSRSTTYFNGYRTEVDVFELSEIRHCYLTAKYRGNPYNVLRIGVGLSDVELELRIDHADEDIALGFHFDLKDRLGEKLVTVSELDELIIHKQLRYFDAGGFAAFADQRRLSENDPRENSP